MEETAPGYRVLEPSAQQWAAVPLRAPAKPVRLVAWLIGLLTTAVAFVLDRGWEGFDDDSVPAWDGPYRMIDMFGLAGIGLAIVFGLAGWATGRFAVVLSPAVLLAAAFPHALDGYSVTSVWWTGAAVALGWLGYSVFDGIRQLRAVHSLAASCATSSELRLSKDAAQLPLRSSFRDWLWALGLGLAAVVAWVWTFQAFTNEKGQIWEQVGDSLISDLLASAALALSALALGQLTGCLLSVWSSSRVGAVVWKLPQAPGPVLDFGLMGGRDAATILAEGEGNVPRCICQAELIQVFPLDADDIRDSDEFSAGPHCPVHGIDVINALTHDQFRDMAHVPWLWDENSMVPAGNELLVGYAGYPFTGFSARADRQGLVQIAPWSGPALERRRGEEDSPVTHAPSVGLLDSIDLRSVGIRGSARRFKHSRAWFDPES